MDTRTRKLKARTRTVFNWRREAKGIGKGRLFSMTPEKKAAANQKEREAAAAPF